MIIRFYSHEDQCAYEYIKERIEFWGDPTIEFDISMRNLPHGSVLHSKKCDKRRAELRERVNEAKDEPRKKVSFTDIAADSSGIDM